MIKTRIHIIRSIKFIAVVSLILCLYAGGSVGDDTLSDRADLRYVNLSGLDLRGVHLN
ncbi:MAG: hypothetical protein METHAR1v1_330015, partial [Methanothrix sp.]